MSGLGKKREDEVAYLLEYNDDQTQMRLTLFSGTKVNAEMFLQALSVYVDDFTEDPNQIFRDACEMEDGRH